MFLFLYVWEMWTITAGIERRIQALEMRCLRKLLSISYRDHITNEEVKAIWKQGHVDLIAEGWWRSSAEGGASASLAVKSLLKTVISNGCKVSSQNKNFLRRMGRKMKVGKKTEIIWWKSLVDDHRLSDWLVSLWTIQSMVCPCLCEGTWTDWTRPKESNRCIKLAVSADPWFIPVFSRVVGWGSVSSTDF